MTSPAIPLTSVHYEPDGGVWELHLEYTLFKDDEMKMRGRFYSEVSHHSTPHHAEYSAWYATKEYMSGFRPGAAQLIVELDNRDGEEWTKVTMPHPNCAVVSWMVKKNHDCRVVVLGVLEDGQDVVGCAVLGSNCDVPVRTIASK
jgi:hypothetical protein